MFYNKTMRAIDAYYKLRVFNADKEIKNSGLREELLNKEIYTWSDGLRDHYAKVSQIIDDPQLFELNILEKALKYIKEYKHLDNIIKSKYLDNVVESDITIIGVNDDTKRKK